MSIKIVSKWYRRVYTHTPSAQSSHPRNQPHQLRRTSPSKIRLSSGFVSHFNGCSGFFTMWGAQHKTKRTRGVTSHSVHCQWV